MNIWEKSNSARRRSKCKGPEAAVCLEARRPTWLESSEQELERWMRRASTPLRQVPEQRERQEIDRRSDSYWHSAELRRGGKEGAQNTSGEVHLRQEGCSCHCNREKKKTLAQSSDDELSQEEIILYCEPNSF